MKILVDEFNVEECPFRVAHVCWFPAIMSDKRFGLPCQTDMYNEDTKRGQAYWNECQFLKENHNA